MKMVILPEESFKSSDHRQVEILRLIENLEPGEIIEVDEWNEEEGGIDTRHMRKLGSGKLVVYVRDNKPLSPDLPPERQDLGIRIWKFAKKKIVKKQFVKPLSLEERVIAVLKRKCEKIGYFTQSDVSHLQTYGNRNERWAIIEKLMESKILFKEEIRPKVGRPKTVYHFR